jgi:predicted transcriptional regulator
MDAMMTLRLERETKERLEALARKDSRSLSNLIRKVLNEVAANEEREGT